MHEQSDDDLKVVELDSILHVPFATASDALIAQLALLYEVPHKLVDEFLALLSRSDSVQSTEIPKMVFHATAVGRAPPSHAELVMDLLARILAHPKFTPSEVTLNRAADTDGRVCEYKHEKSRISSFRQGTAAGMPDTVLRAVVDNIVADRSRAVFTGHGFQTSTPLDWQSLLTKMALVHSSWTPICQRALRQTITLSHPEDLSLFVHSPLCGPWVYEFACELNGLSSKTERDNNEGKESTSLVFGTSNCQRLVSSLQRMPYIRKFRCRTLPYSTSNIGDVIQAMRTLLCLEVIWLDQVSCPLAILGDLCMFLPSLRRLRFLGINGCGEFEAETQILESPLRSPPPSLKAFFIGKVSITSDAAILCLEWLLRAREDFSLTDIYFAEVTVSEQSLLVIADALDSSLSHLKSAGFQFRSDPERNLGGNMQQQIWTLPLAECVAGMVARCIRLRELYLQVDLQAYPKQAILPPALELLHVICPHARNSSFGTFDWKLSQLLSRSYLPRLFRVELDAYVVSAPPLTASLSAIGESQAPATFAFCRKRGITITGGSTAPHANHLRDHLG